jgi:hypothetical protein
MAQLIIGSPPVFVDVADATVASNRPLTATNFLRISRNAKHGSVRHEVIYMGFFGNGDTVPLPISPVDGYTYGQEEIQYNFRLYSTRAPGAGFTPGQKTVPAISGDQNGNLYYWTASIDDATGYVSLLTSSYKEGGREDTPFDGIVKVYAICQRNDQVIIPGTIGPPGGAIVGTLPTPSVWHLTANLDGDLRLSFNIPGSDTVGAVVDSSLNAGGSGYLDGGIYTLVGGDNNCTVIVLASPVLGGAITGYRLVNPGTGYSAGTFSLTGPGGGSSGSIDVTAVQESADYRFGDLELLIDDEKNRIETSLASALGSGDSTMAVNSSTGFLVGDYVGVQTEIVKITGPGTDGQQPTSTTWTIDRAQKLTSAGTAVIADLVFRLINTPIHWSIPPGYTLDHPTGDLATGPYYVLTFRPGRMRILYASLQLFGPSEGATNLLEQGFDQFAYEPIVPNTLPGLRAADGDYGLIQVDGNISVTSQAASSLKLPGTPMTIGVIYAYTVADDGSAGGAPVGSSILGQLKIQAPQIGDAVTYYDLGDPMELGTTTVGPIATSHLVSAGYGYHVGDICSLIGASSDAQVRIDSVGSGGAVTGYTLVNAGTGYVVGNTYFIRGLYGSGASVGIDTVTAGSSSSTGVYFSGAQLGNVSGANIILEITQVGSTSPGRNLRVYITF